MQCIQKGKHVHGYDVYLDGCADNQQAETLCLKITKISNFQTKSGKTLGHANCLTKTFHICMDVFTSIFCFNYKIFKDKFELDIFKRTVVK